MTTVDPRYLQSAAWHALAARVIPGGTATLSKRAERFPLGAFPTTLRFCSGAYATDVDDHKYVDWIMSLGAVSLGHSHPAVAHAVAEAVQRGTVYSLPAKLEAEVAAQLCALIPCGRDGGQVRFVSTGTEAAMGAIRVARIATERDHVLVCGYHGWADWYVATKPAHPGVPEVLENLAYAVPYNDLAALGDALAFRPAALIMEPVLFERPGDGYLAAVKAACHAAGTLLIFDETVTGGRLALAGGQEAYGVTPDLAVFGKALGGGLPLGFIIGPEWIMQHAWPVSGTFGGNPLSLAACRAALKVYQEQDVITHMHRAGIALVELLCDAFANRGMDARVVGPAWHPRVDFPTLTHLSVFVQELAARGVLWHPAGVNPALCHDDTGVLTATTAAVRETVALMAARWDDVGSLLRGAVVQPAAGVRT